MGEKIGGKQSNRETFKELQEITGFFESISDDSNARIGGRTGFRKQGKLECIQNCG